MAVFTGISHRTKLEQLLKTSAKERRPLLTHLSADNSWLLSTPMPRETPSAISNDNKQVHRKVYFHLLLDPWLTPSNSPFPGARWFQEQYHVEAPACPSIGAVTQRISNIEAAASSQSSLDNQNKIGLDAVIVGHNAPDHMNYDTLIQVDASVPVFASNVAFATIQSWNHFDIVVQIPNLEAGSESIDWQSNASAHLPSWLAVWRIFGPKTPPYLHWGSGKANLGARHGAQIAEVIGAKYCELASFYLS